MIEFTGIRMMVKAEVNTHGYKVVEMNKQGVKRNTIIKSNETNIRVNKSIIGEVLISGICVKIIKDDDERSIDMIWTEQFNR